LGLGLLATSSGRQRELVELKPLLN
jgi:hypothetical protein